MSFFTTTRMSSKGQVVIPEEIRDRLHLSPGSRFVVLGEGDVVIFKTIAAPSMDDFDVLIDRSRKQAKAAGMRAADVSKAVSAVRRARK